MIRLWLTIVGNVLYHFDRALFSLLIPFLAPVFFPQVDPIYALIYMYAISPLSLVAKPLGAIVFGHLGDRIGKRRVLSITLMGMAIKTGLMGFLPTYEQVGSIAPIILALTRLSLGFFAAGETTGGAIFILDQSAIEKRGFASSLFHASGKLGIIVASICIWLLSDYEGFWRLLFWIGGVIGVIGWFYRKLPEEEEINAKVMPSWNILWQYKKEVFAIAAVAGFSYANYYLITKFMNGFLPLVSDITKTEVISLHSMMLVLDLCLLPLFGLISLKVRKESLMLIAIFGIMLSVVPLFLLLQEATLVKAAVIRITLMTFGVCIAAPYHAWAYERAPAKHRYLICAFGATLGVQLFGSHIPMLGLWLYKVTGLTTAPTIPVILMGILPFIALSRSLVQTRKEVSVS